MDSSGRAGIIDALSLGTDHAEGKVMINTISTSRQLTHGSVMQGRVTFHVRLCAAFVVSWIRSLGLFRLGHGQ